MRVRLEEAEGTISNPRAEHSKKAAWNREARETFSITTADVTAVVSI
jgi:hypothetical protein